MVVGYRLEVSSPCWWNTECFHEPCPISHGDTRPGVVLTRNISAQIIGGVAPSIRLEGFKVGPSSLPDVGFLRPNHRVLLAEVGHSFPIRGSGAPDLAARQRPSVLLRWAPTTRGHRSGWPYLVSFFSPFFGGTRTGSGQRGPRVSPKVVPRSLRPTRGRTQSVTHARWSRARCRTPRVAFRFS